MRKILLTLLTTLLCSVTAWGATAKTSIGTLSSDVTGTATNKKFTTYFSGSVGVVGNIYASRNGSNIAISANGTQINGAVNFVFQTSGVYAISLKLLQQSTKKDPFYLYVASITDDAYSKVLSSQSNNVNYEDKTNGGNWSNLQITSGGALKKTFAFDVDDYPTASYTGTITTVPAGKYTIYFSGNNYVYVQDITFTPAVMYDKNEGTGDAMSATVAVPTSDITIASNTYTAPAGKQFKEWNTQADGGGISYAPGATTSTGLYLYAIWEDAGGGGCSAPTSPSISGTTAYTAGNNISLSASATGTSASTTYTWYKGADWATASASSPVQAASTSGAIFSKASCSMSDAGTYWCEISNGTGCDVQVSQAITVACKNPTQTFTNSDYTIGGAALNLSTKFSSNSSGAVTYSVQNAGGTGASIAGTSFSATTEGTATVRASQDANGDYCAKTIDASVSVTADDCTDPGLTITLN